MIARVWNYVVERLKPSSEVKGKPYRTRQQLRM